MNVDTGRLCLDIQVDKIASRLHHQIGIQKSFFIGLKDSSKVLQIQ